MQRPRGWTHAFDIGRYWRNALVLFFNYGLDTGTVWKWKAVHEPILWRNVTWSKACPGGRGKKSSPWGWITYRRVKTNKVFIRPMNSAVHSHLKNLHHGDCRPVEVAVQSFGSLGLVLSAPRSNGLEVLKSTYS